MYHAKGIFGRPKKYEKRLRLMLGSDGNIFTLYIFLGDSLPRCQEVLLGNQKLGNLQIVSQSWALMSIISRCSADYPFLRTLGDLDFLPLIHISEDYYIFLVFFFFSSESLSGMCSIFESCLSWLHKHQLLASITTPTTFQMLNSFTANRDLVEDSINFDFVKVYQCC